ncbi:zinc ABC transporter substrate-binding protein [Cryobacterium roopkundense]|uniref:Iron complex transport system substrate-binding protein n=1 Tax=Cryobacterium roopkundense TaxID=1001240 RepID=A0A099J1N1_9MICO|nr:ABC transporter substrate-binding protein [Cryobacterium roopkundense]KGJ72121.1 zinc ABC transporter substrate-binding protein [Cryobacterium roopkundense]MBB5640695.1 iron complex transport system substrate-binding protein [Cryobacterium roopkundense]
MMTRILTRTFAATAGATGLVLLLGACGTAVGASPAQTSGSGATVAIENCGRTLEFAGVPTSAVGLSPSQTELLLRLGLADSLVGQAQVATADLPADVAAQASDIPVLSEDAPPTREVLLSAEPDFVYSPTGYEFTAEQGFASIAQLDQAGVNAYTATGGCLERRNAGTVDDIFTDIDNLGRIFDVPNDATALIDEGRAQLAAVETAIAVEPRLSVAQLFVDGTSLSAIGAGVEYDMILRAGGDNVYSPTDAAFADFFAASISPESLAAANPEAIVFAVSTEEQALETEAYLRATFPNLAAVQNDRLIAISASDVFPGTLGNIRVVQQLAAELYPAAF